MRGRSRGFWIGIAFVACAVGLALDKGFADDTPPYDEPPIAYLGFVAFILGGAAFCSLCAIAAADAMRFTAVAALPLIALVVLGITSGEWYFSTVWLFSAIFIVALTLAVLRKKLRQTRG